jgi:hypothetical protein
MFQETFQDTKHRGWKVYVNGAPPTTKRRSALNKGDFWVIPKGADIAPSVPGMRPAPAFEPAISAPFDLGRIDPAYAGMQVVFDCAVDFGVVNLLNILHDPGTDAHEFVRAAEQFARRVLVRWNFRRQRLVDGRLVTTELPQPPKGVSSLPVSSAPGLMEAIIEAYERCSQRPMPA